MMNAGEKPGDNAVRREVLFAVPVERVWRALADRTLLAAWMFPNDFEARVGHRFTFEVPGNPQMKFDGLTVRCEVLVCEAPHRLVFSWAAGGAVEHTRVEFRLEAEGNGTRMYLEHTGFDLTQAFGLQALKGAGYGWAKMLKQLEEVVTGAASATNRSENQS
jgi:uncharacterized protein YndB with AHSA1/START domain